MKKKLLRTYIVLLMLLLVVDGLSYLLLDVRQVLCKFKSQESISENKGLLVLTIPLKTFSQQNNKHEIWVKGALYDISKYCISADSVRVTVFHDNDEECLVNTLISCFEATNNCCYNYSGHHISRIRPRIINDSKILPEQYQYVGSIQLFSSNQVPDRYYDYVPYLYSDIIKPPPIYTVASVS